MLIKVEIDRIDDWLTDIEADYDRVQQTSRRIRINGKMMPPDFTVMVKHDRIKPTGVLLDGGRPLFPTEVWVEGRLFARVPGLVEEEQ